MEKDHDQRCTCDACNEQNKMDIAFIEQAEAGDAVRLYGNVFRLKVSGKEWLGSDQPEKSDET